MTSSAAAAHDEVRTTGTENETENTKHMLIQPCLSHGIAPTHPTHIQVFEMLSTGA